MLTTRELSSFIRRYYLGGLFKKANGKVGSRWQVSNYRLTVSGMTIDKTFAMFCYWNSFPMVDCDLVLLDSQGLIPRLKLDDMPVKLSLKRNVLTVRGKRMELSCETVSTDDKPIAIKRVAPVTLEISLDTPLVEFINKGKEVSNRITFGHRDRTKTLSAWVTYPAHPDSHPPHENKWTLKRLTYHGTRLKHSLSFNLEHLAAVINANQDIIHARTVLKVSSEGATWLDLVAGDLVCRYFFFVQTD